MSELETQNPNDDPIQPDPLLDPGSFIEPNEPGPEHVAFEPDTAIAAEPLSIVSPDGTPIHMPSLAQPLKRNPEEMAKRPDWLPGNFSIELKIRSSGATAGQIDRYYVAPSGLKCRSKADVMYYMETGTKQKKRKFATEGEAGSSGSTSNVKQKTSVKRKSSSSALKSDNNVASTTCL